MCSKFLSLQLISSDRDIHPLEVGNSQAPNTYNSDAGIFLAMVSCTDQTGHLVLTSSWRNNASTSRTLLMDGRICHFVHHFPHRWKDLMQCQLLILPPTPISLKSLACSWLIFRWTCSHNSPYRLLHYESQIVQFLCCWFVNLQLFTGPIKQVPWASRLIFGHHGFQFLEWGVAWPC